MSHKKVAFRQLENSVIVSVRMVSGSDIKFSGEDNTGKLQVVFSNGLVLEPFEWNFVPNTVRCGNYPNDGTLKGVVLYPNLSIVDMDQFSAALEPINEVPSLSELQTLLSVVECLIDTANSTTDLKGVYSSGDEQFFTWEEVFKSYTLLKRLAKVE